jgi:hypothetical protein
MSQNTMTHTDITAQEILATLPPEKAEALRTRATQKRVPLSTLLKEGLLKIADEINASQQKQNPRPA